jgi:hypothetical protein
MVENISLLELLTKELSSLKDSRRNWEDQWQSVGDLMSPNRGDFVALRSAGERKREKIFDSTPQRALTRFSSAMHNLLTPSTQNWFELQLVQDILNQEKEVQLWLEEVTKIVMRAFSRPNNNFHPSMHEYFLDLGAFGTGVMFVRDIPGEGPYFMTFPLYDCYLAKNDTGRIDTIFRLYEHTAKELIESFGEENLPEKVLKAKESNKIYDKFACCHVVKPTATFKEPPQNRFPWTSIYLMPDEKALINVGGFNEFPFICSRWERNSLETYGRGPGAEALADVKMLNEMEKTYLKALQKMVDPPLMVPDDGFINPVRTTPGGLNYYRTGLGRDERIFPLPMMQRLDYADNKMNQVRDSINKAFYLDLVELPGPTAQDGDVLRFTATEIQARQRDRMQILGPLVSRQEIELLGPMIGRVVNVMLENNMLPQPPEIIMEQKEFKIEYRNPISIAMRGYELNSISQLIQFLAPMAQIDPTVMQRLDISRIAKLGAEVLRTPPSVVKDEALFKAEMEAQQQQQAMMAQLQAGQMVAGIDETSANAERSRAQASAVIAGNA